MTLFAISLYLMLPFHPGWQCLHQQCVSVEISNNTLKIDSILDHEISMLKDINKNTNNGRSLYISPSRPGAYALLERKSPTWEVYAIYPRSEQFEKDELEKIKLADPEYALIIDEPLDNREDLYFHNTHPLTYKYFLNNYELLPESSYNKTYQLFHRK